MHTPVEASLIVTLAMDEANQARFEQERQRWYPGAWNRVPAHVTLFHALPGIHLEAVRALLRETAETIRAFPLRVASVSRLGRGVAYRLQSPELSQLHHALRGGWFASLTPQDRQPYHPHVVIQNKAEPEAARALFAQLQATFEPWAAEARGLLLWRYLGGPWAPEDFFPFAQEV